MKILQTEGEVLLESEFKRDGIVDFKNDYTIWLNGVYIKGNKFGIVDYFTDNQNVYIVTYFPLFGIIKLDSNNLTIEKTWYFNDISDFKKEFIEDEDGDNKKQRTQKNFNDHRVVFAQDSGAVYFSAGSYLFKRDIINGEEKWLYTDCRENIKKILFYKNRLILLTTKGFLEVDFGKKITNKYIWKLKTGEIIDGVIQYDKIMILYKFKNNYYFRKSDFNEQFIKHDDKSLFLFTDRKGIKDVQNNHKEQNDQKADSENSEVVKDGNNSLTKIDINSISEIIEPKNINIKDYLGTIDNAGFENKVEGSSDFINQMIASMINNFDKYSLKIYKNPILNVIEETGITNIGDENIILDKDAMKALMKEIFLKRYKHLNTNPFLRSPYKRLDIDYRKYEKNPPVLVKDTDMELLKKSLSEKLSTLYWYKNIETKKTFKLEFVFGEKNVTNMLWCPQRITDLDNKKVILIKYFDGYQFYKDVIFIKK